MLKKWKEERNAPMSRLMIFALLLLGIGIIMFAAAQIHRYATRGSSSPRITMTSDSVTVSVKDGDKAILKGVTAEDSGDGDVTGSLVVESMTNMDHGKRIATICAFDNDNNVTKAYRTVRYRDYVPPRFTIRQPLRMATNDYMFDDIEKVMTVKDCLDGDITGNIRFQNTKNVNPNKAGDYPITIRVSNSAGDVEDLPVTITYYDKERASEIPMIYLKKYIVYTKVGQKISPASYFKYVEYHGIRSRSMGASGGGGAVSVDASKVNYSKAGVYEAVFSCKGSEGARGTARLIIVVEDD